MGREASRKVIPADGLVRYTSKGIPLAVRVDAEELVQLFEATPPNHNIMLVGRHGIGKSQIIAEHYHSKSMTVVPFFLGQMSDPGDLIGLLNKNETTGRSEFLPPFWWPADDQPIVLFLDELNRARPEILQSVMELALNKTLAGRRLPDGSRVIAAVNEGDEYQLTDLDPALVSRFNLYEFAPTVHDWMIWAEKHDIDDRVKSFVRQSPQFLDGDGNADAPGQSVLSGLIKTPDRRGWSRVSDLLATIESLTDTHFKMVAGIVGSTAANAFRKSLAMPLAVTPKQALLQFDHSASLLGKLSLAELLSLNEQLMIWIAAEKCPSGSTDEAREGLLAYIQLLRKRKLDEAVAHLVAMLERPKYESVMAFIAESLELTEQLTQYMEGIRVE
ncbi:MAG: AAA family ATPase [Planctomycetota bacterium]